MNAIPGYVLGLLFCGGIFLFGRYSIAQPERMARIFAWGQPPVRFAVAFFRIAGRFFYVMAVIGVVFYLAATLVVLFRH